MGHNTMVIENNNFIGRILFWYQVVVKDGRKQVIKENINLTEHQGKVVQPVLELLNKDLDFIEESISQPLTPRGEHFKNEEAQEEYNKSIDHYNNIIFGLKKLKIQYISNLDITCTDASYNSSYGPIRNQPKI